MKHVGLGFAVAFVLAMELVFSLGFLVSPEDARQSGEFVIDLSISASMVMVHAAIIVLLYGVTRRLYRWAVNDLEDVGRDASV